ncbi:RimK/LysX family protein, partial [Vibrio sp. 10N.261.45.A4]
KPNERPVVMMDVTLGEVSKTVRVNLQDRSRFEYSMILGKNFLKNGVVVGSDNTYLLGK